MDVSLELSITVHDCMLYLFSILLEIYLKRFLSKLERVSVQALFNDIHSITYS